MKHVTEIKYEAMETDSLCAVYNQFTGNLIMNTSCEDHEGKVIVLGLRIKSRGRFRRLSSCCRKIYRRQDDDKCDKAGGKRAGEYPR